MMSVELEKHCKRLAKIRQGRIDALKATAVAIGRIPSIDRSAAIAALRSACFENGTFEKEPSRLIEKTIIDGLDEGKPVNGNGYNPNGRGTLETRAASSFSLRAIRWLWPNRFALGKLGLLGGLPDKGKSLITYDMMASVTANHPLPCNEGHTPQGSVIYFTAEDDIEDTVIPRLKAAGANLDRVHIVQMMHDHDGKRRTFSMVTDLEALRSKIEEIPDTQLVFIDPMSAYLGIGKVNNSMTTDVRGFLKPLTDLAAEKGVSIIGVMHFNKKQDVTNAMLRIADSLAYVAAARHVYVVVDDPEVDKRRLFVKAKNNLAPDTKALSYMTGLRSVGTDDDTGKEIWAPHIIWGAEHVEITANEAMQAEAGGTKGRSERREAKSFLQERLADGPVPQEAVIAEAAAIDISETTLRRAKKDLGIKSRKGKGHDNSWTWELSA